MPNATLRAMKPLPAPTRSTPEVFLDTLTLAEQSFCTWMEIERHVKDAEQQIRDIRSRMAEFDLRR